MANTDYTERIVDGIGGDRWKTTSERMSFEILNGLGEYEETAFVYWGKDNLFAIISALASFLPQADAYKLIYELMTKFKMELATRPALKRIIKEGVDDWVDAMQRKELK